MKACRSFIWAAVPLGMMLFASEGQAYSRYRDPLTGTGDCSECHGAFTNSTSPKGTVFPANSNHEMHKASTSMATSCGLCHFSTDGNNPFMYQSDGIPASVQGRGCSGCHRGLGLRRHHAAKGVTVCAACHDDTGFTPPQENLPPPYYGTAYTRVSNPSNDVAIANTNENWSIGDFRGLDNDGDTLYDMNDPACWLASGLWGGASDTGGGWAQLSWFGSFRSFGPPG